jgi:hypothetical protein
MNSAFHGRRMFIYTKYCPDPDEFTPHKLILEDTFWYHQAFLLQFHICFICLLRSESIANLVILYLITLIVNEQYKLVSFSLCCFLLSLALEDNCRL